MIVWVTTHALQPHCVHIVISSSHMAVFTSQCAMVAWHARCRCAIKILLDLMIEVGSYMLSNQWRNFQLVSDQHVSITKSIPLILITNTRIVDLIFIWIRKKQNRKNPCFFALCLKWASFLDNISSLKATTWNNEKK